MQLPTVGAGAPQPAKFRICNTITSAVRLFFNIDEQSEFMLLDSEGALLSAVPENLTDGLTYTVQVCAGSRSGRETGAGGNTASVSALFTAAAADVPKEGFKPPSLPEYPDGKRSWVATVKADQKSDYNFTGWATESTRSRNGQSREVSYRKCVGVFSCPRPECKFTLRPVVRKKAREAQKKATCNHHPEQVPCSVLLLCMQPSLCVHVQTLQYHQCGRKLHVHRTMFKEKGAVRLCRHGFRSLAHAPRAFCR
jgi:hypothetical protein